MLVILKGKNKNTPSSQSRGYQKKRPSSKSETSYNSLACSSSHGPLRQPRRREKECVRPLTQGSREPVLYGAPTSKLNYRSFIGHWKKDEPVFYN